MVGSFLYRMPLNVFRLRDHNESLPATLRRWPAHMVPGLPVWLLHTNGHSQGREHHASLGVAHLLKRTLRWFLYRLRAFALSQKASFAAHCSV